MVCSQLERFSSKKLLTSRFSENGEVDTDDMLAAASPPSSAPSLSMVPATKKSLVNSSPSLCCDGSNRQAEWNNKRRRKTYVCTWR